jgi:hypothetical protein
LWTDPLFTPSRLVCPRCGAVFKPTVPWAFFRILVLIILALSVTLIVFIAGYRPWLILVFLFVLGASSGTYRAWSTFCHLGSSACLTARSRSMRLI